MKNHQAIQESCQTKARNWHVNCISLLQSGQGHDRESTEESIKDSRWVLTSSLPNETANSELMQYDLPKKKG